MLSKPDWHITKVLLALLLSLLSSCPAYADAHWQETCAEAIETKLPVYRWQEAPQSAKGVVLLLHGMAERACTLKILAQQLASNGFTVYGLDERGHGWWHFHQKKGSPGYTCDFSGTVKDVDQVLSVLKKNHPGLPVLLVGESIGAAVAWRAAAHNPQAVDAAVMTGTGSVAGHAKIIWIWGDILRNWFRWNHQINIVRYQLKYGTDDVQAFEETLKDPEQRKTMSLSEMIRMQRFISKNRKFAQRLAPHTSVLILQGECDQVLSPASAKRVFESANTLDKHFIVIPKCGHIIIGSSRLKPLVSDSIIMFMNEIAERYALSSESSSTSQSALGPAVDFADSTATAALRSAQK